MSKLILSKIITQPQNNVHYTPEGQEPSLSPRSTSVVLAHKISAVILSISSERPHCGTPMRLNHHSSVVRQSQRSGRKHSPPSDFRETVCTQYPNVCMCYFRRSRGEWGQGRGVGRGDRSV